MAALPSPPMFSCSLLVKIAAQIVILILNYIFSKLVIFKKREDGAKK